MDINDQEMEKLLLHTRLWSTYNLILWLLFSITIIGLVLGGLWVNQISYSFVWYDFPNELNQLFIRSTLFYLLCGMPLIFYLIMKKFYSIQLYHRNIVRIKSMETLKEDITFNSSSHITKLGGIPDFVILGSIYYFFFMFYLIQGILMIFSIISVNRFVLLFLRILLWGAVICIYYFYWYQELRNQFLTDKTTKPIDKTINLFRDFFKKTPKKTYYQNI